MSYETIEVRRQGPAEIVTLSRPERRNAISLAMMAEIGAAAREAESDTAVRALILTGGPEYFSAGADLTEAIQVKSPADGLGYFGSLHRLNAAIEALTKPVIAAMEGFCMTGGCGLAFAWELRVERDEADVHISRLLLQ